MSVEEKTGSIEYPGIEYPEFVTLADSARGTGAKPVRFDAVLQPHTTLGPRSFLLFMAVFGTVSFIAGVSFLLVSGWPVFGFAALDVLLIYYAYRSSPRTSTIV